MEYKVPQNIDVEDKVVGPLSMRQFVILLIAAAFVVVFYMSFGESASFLFFILAVAIFGGAAGLAFFDYGGQHLEKIIADAIVSNINPKKMVWKKEAEHQNVQSQESGQSTQNETTVTKGNLDEAKARLHQAASLADATRIGDTPGAPDPLMNQNPFLDKQLENATAGTKRDEPLVSQLATVSPAQKFEYPKIEVKKHPYK